MDWNSFRVLETSFLLYLGLYLAGTLRLPDARNSNTRGRPVCSADRSKWLWRALLGQLHWSLGKRKSYSLDHGTPLVLPLSRKSILAVLRNSGSCAPRLRPLFGRSWVRTVGKWQWFRPMEDLGDGMGVKFKFYLRVDIRYKWLLVN